MSQDNIITVASQENITVSQDNTGIHNDITVTSQGITRQHHTSKCIDIKTRHHGNDITVTSLENVLQHHNDDITSTGDSGWIEQLTTGKPSHHGTTLLHYGMQ